MHCLDEPFSVYNSKKETEIENERCEKSKVEDKERMRWKVLEGL
jgi:hypothetical protein